MKKYYKGKIGKLFVSFLLFGAFLFTGAAYGQSEPMDGDFRSVGTGGNWEENTTWLRYLETEGGWVSAEQGEIPGADNSVYIEENTTVVVSSNQSCKNLNINGASDVDRLIIGNNVLEVWGLLRFYSGIAPGLDERPIGLIPGQYLKTEVDGAVRFRGSEERTISDGTANANDGLAGWNMEFAFDDGVTGFIDGQIRVGNLTVASGSLRIRASVLRPSGAGGPEPDGTITIKSGARLSGATTGFFKGSATPFKRLEMEEGSEFFIDDDRLNVAATEYDIKGKVVFEGLVAQTFPITGTRDGAVTWSTFQDVVIQNTTKTIQSNVTINGMLTRENSNIALNGFTFGYGSEGSLKYAGTTAQNTGAEFPATNSPSNVIIANPNGVSLAADRQINGTLTLEEGNFILGNFNFTLGAGSPAVAGSLSATRMIVTNGPGKLRKIFATAGEYLFPVGELVGESNLAPARIRVTSGELGESTFIGVSTTDGKHPDDVSDVSSGDYISRYWSVNTNLTTYKLFGSFNYLDEDLNGDASNLNTYVYTGGGSAAPIGPVNGAANLLEFNGISVVGDFSGSNFCGVTQNLIEQPEADSLCIGTNPALITASTPNVISGTPVYEWQVRFDSTEWVTIPDADAITLDGIEFPEAGVYEYRRLVSSSDCSISNISNNIKFQVFPEISNNEIVAPTVAEFCGEAVGFEITGSAPNGGNNNYAYIFERKFNDGEWIEVGNSQNLTESALEAVGTYQYRRITNSGGCESVSNIVEINVFEGITVVETITGATSGGNTGSIVLEVTGGGDSYEYSWSNGAETQNLTNVPAGDYTVTITSNGACEFTDTYTIGEITGITNNVNVREYKLYPNPVEETLFVNLKLIKEMHVKVELYNAAGKLIHTSASDLTNNLALELNMRGLPSGLYYVKTYVNDSVEVRKVIKNIIF